MDSFDARYLQLQRYVARHPRTALSLFVILVLVATLGVASLRMDLSFRPLFASSPERAAPTEAFEEVFGQASGAWILAVVENQSLSEGEFVRLVAELSDKVMSLHGVLEVLSLPTARAPEWQRGSLSFVRPVPEYLLDPAEEEELGYQFEQILDGTRFVNWLVSEDGQQMLIAARVGPPLDDLDGRRTIIAEFRETLDASVPTSVQLHFSGVSVVELAYEREVLIDQIVATVLATSGLMLLLLLTFGDLRLVMICLMPVTFAIPATFGVMGWLGYPVTIINTAIPALILVVGVADAVHMLNQWLAARAAGTDLSSSTEQMLMATGKACFFTTVTTVAGFLSLTVAELESVGVFGVAAATGIFFAWLGNQLLLPWITRRVPLGTNVVSRAANRLADRAVIDTVAWSIRHPLRVIGVFALVAGLSVWAVTRLDVDQKFNEELPKDHPITVSQALIEERFTGFLGPEVSIRRNDGQSILSESSRTNLASFIAAVSELQDVQIVWSILDLVPRNVPVTDWPQVLTALRESPQTTRLTSELVSDGHDQLAVMVRLGDVGTARAAELVFEIKRIAAANFSNGYEIDVVGQWWLAQQGMSLLLRDMLTSLAAALLIIAPLLWVALRDARLFFAAMVTNILPLLLPLAFMSVTGIPLRIGTAVVLAIALGIVVDNTLHISIRFRSDRFDAAEGSQTDNPMGGAGRAVLFTTLALGAGFLSMMVNDLLAIRDMGLVAAVTIAGAMFADLLLLPAVFSLLSGQPKSAGARLGVFPNTGPGTS